MLDIKLLNAKIYDGTGRDFYISDIGIIGDKIAEIGNLKDASAQTVLDVDGLSVFPGIIDSHTHSDIALINSPERHEAIKQGITCEIISSCGIGAVPLSDNRAYLKTVEAVSGYPERAFDSSSVAAYSSELSKNGTAVNVGIALAHSPLRAEAYGLSDISPSKEQKDKLLRLADEAFSQGACAFTTGLAYYPASFSDTEEIIEIGKIAAKYDVPICVHQRTALRDTSLSFNSREEVLDFGRGSGARVHYSHYRTTPKTAGGLNELLEPIERGISEGLRVTADFYPYQIGSGYLPVFLPFGVMDSDTDTILEKLTDSRCSAKIKKAFSEKAVLSSDSIITEVSKNTELLGKSFEEAAADSGKSVTDFMYDLLIDERLNVGYRLNADFDKESLEKLELDFIELIKKPYYMVGSDTLPLNKNPHPRSYGAIARMFPLARRHGLDLKILANRMCSNPAKLFGLKQRGEILKNNFADIIVFDENALSDTATFKNPKKYSDGMKHVIVNGQFALKDGEFTNILSGRALKCEN